MTDTPDKSIHHRQGLAAGELAAVRELARACEQYDGIDLRIGWRALEDRSADAPHTFLAYRAGALAGFFAMYGLGDDEAEATGLVHPDLRRRGVFRALVDAAREACRGQGTPALVLYVDSRSQAAKPFMDVIGAERSFSEAKMRLADAGAVAETTENLDFRRATGDDAPAIGDILARDMDSDATALRQVVARNMQNPIYRYYIASLGAEPVGTLNIQTIDGEKYVYGFVVREEYRGRGYGREILARALRDLAAEGTQSVLLEVEPDNAPAVNLYRSLGFVPLVTYDYYRLAV